MSMISQLIAAGYKIENAKITDVDLSMADHGCLTLDIGLEGYGWFCNYGGRYLGSGYLGAKEFKSCPQGLEYIMRIMDTVGVEHLSDLKDKYVRVATKGWGVEITSIGNIISDKWFDADEFFQKIKEEN